MTTAKGHYLDVVYGAHTSPIGAIFHRVDAEGLDVWESWLGYTVGPDGLLVSLRERIGSFRRESQARRRVHEAEKARAFLARCKRTAGRVLE